MAQISCFSVVSHEMVCQPLALSFPKSVSRFMTGTRINCPTRWSLLVLFAMLTSTASIHSQPAGWKPPAITHPLPPHIRAFVAAQEIEARALVADLKLEVPSDFWIYFELAKGGEIAAARDLVIKHEQGSRQNPGGVHAKSLASPVWQTVIDTAVTFENYGVGGAKYWDAFARGISSNVTAGAIYFGGTDAGRSLVTAHLKSHAKGDPFFLVAQNSLTRGPYLDYVNWLFGNRIWLPDAAALKSAQESYLQDAERRLEHDLKFPERPRQIRLGEDVRKVDGKVKASGAVADMVVNAVLAKMIFERNPQREFFVEESFPLDWMYPHLSPHGFVLKLNREPLASLDEETLARDREFWRAQVKPMIGGWLQPETPVKEVCAFVERVFADKNLTGFEGDPQFVGDAASRQSFAKLRCAIAGVYNFRLSSLDGAPPRKEDLAKYQAEYARLQAATDFAFRQAFALCPSSPEAVFRYINFLSAKGRLDDALLIAKSFLKIDPGNAAAKGLMEQLEKFNKLK